jgi:hypothetical protein
MISWGPEPFTATQNYTKPEGIIAQIRVARSKKQRLILAMTGGPAERYTTDGNFDMRKWKARMDSYKKTEIIEAVAAGVVDGTIIGNQLIDEPETRRWGSGLNKSLIDEMAAYVKAIFPTLPVGLNHGPPGYLWLATERYQLLDYVLYQYNHYFTAGDVVAWRDSALAQARHDGVAPMFSLNIVNGGVQDRKGPRDCTGTGGLGSRAPNCRMTPAQIREYGSVLGVAGCALLLWRYDATSMSNPDNEQAFRELADKLSTTPAPSCRRPSS